MHSETLLLVMFIKPTKGASRVSLPTSKQEVMQMTYACRVSQKTKAISYAFGFKSTFNTAKYMHQTKVGLLPNETARDDPPLLVRTFVEVRSATQTLERLPDGFPCSGLHVF